MDKEKKIAYITKWKAEQTRRYEFYLKRGDDDELIEYLDKISNRREYFKELVSKDFKKKH